MEQLHFITKLLDIKDPNIQISDIINKDTHKEIIAKLDYDAPSCPECGNQLKKYDFQKPSKIPYLETTGMPTRILLRKRRFKCYHCSKMMVAETSIVKKNHQIPRIINQKIAQKLIEKISMTDIARQLSISTSTIIRKLNDFHFKHDFSCLPEIMSWDEYAFTKGKMSFIDVFPDDWTHLSRNIFHPFEDFSERTLFTKDRDTQILHLFFISSSNLLQASQRFFAKRF
ncbi:IS1167%2C transposase [Streptococcus pneumoniae]|nr:IS1167%2C transposase [Streptococcus pneumoniae]